MFSNKMKQKKEEEFEEPIDDGIPVFDKRRFNGEGERVADDAKSAEPPPTAKEIVLEAQLKAETERREAAEAKLVGVQVKFDEAKSGLEKDTAEMRERLRKTLEDKAKQGQFNFLATLLPVLDNLNLAIAASETDPSVEHLRNGVVGTARSFEQALISVGVEAVPSVGENFDPEIHEAVDMVEADEDGLITKEYARGYKLGDKLLRPARVQVGKA